MPTDCTNASVNSLLAAAKLALLTRHDHKGGPWKADVHADLGLRHGKLFRCKLVGRVLPSANVARLKLAQQGERRGAQLDIQRHLQEAADLLGELQQALLSLVQGTSDGHRQPLLDGLSITLVEELRGGAALALKVVEQRLSQQNGARTNSSI